MCTHSNCSLVAILGLITLSLITGPARADFIPIELETLDVMCETLDADVHGVARVFGIDESAQLAFATFTNPGARSFHYALGARATYLGQPLTLVGNGTYNESLARWEGQTTFSNGGRETWVTTWTYAVQSPDPYLAQTDWLAVGGTRWYPDVHKSIGSKPKPGGGREFWAHIDITWGGALVGSAKGVVTVSASSWDLSTQYVLDPGYGTSFATAFVGQSPETGGAGMAWANVTVIPEPASLLLVAIGATAGIRRGRW